MAVSCSRSIPMLQSFFCSTVLSCARSNPGWSNLVWSWRVLAWRALFLHMHPWQLWLGGNPSIVHRACAGPLGGPLARAPAAAQGAGLQVTATHRLTDGGTVAARQEQHWPDWTAAAGTGQGRTANRAGTGQGHKAWIWRRDRPMRREHVVERLPAAVGGCGACDGLSPGSTCCPHYPFQRTHLRRLVAASGFGAATGRPGGICLLCRTWMAWLSGSLASAP